MARKPKPEDFATVSDDGHSVIVGTGGAAWEIRKEYGGYRTRHTRNGGWKDATGAEMVAAHSIVCLLDLLKARHAPPPPNPQAPTMKEKDRG